MSHELKKTLKLRHVFSIAAGAMVSSGIFILPGIAYGYTGPSLFVSYGIAGFVALIGVLSIIELATAMPKAGGDYYFIGRTFGPLMGTVTGTLSWFALSLKTAFAIFGLAGILSIATGIEMWIWELVLTAFFTALNLVGVEGTASLEVLLVTVLVIIMAAFIGLGVPSVDVARFRPFFKEGFNGMLATSAFVFVSFGGLIQVATIAEEVKHPQKDIQRGALLAITVVTFLYMGIVGVTTGLLDDVDFTGSLTPVADAAAVIAGRPGWMVISVAAGLAFVTTALAGIMSASRYPLALARDGLLPGFLARVSRRNGSPSAAVLITGTLVALSLQLNLDLLVKSASAVFMITYILANIAVIILRESRLTNYKPLFRAPLYPWPQAASVIIYLFLLADMGWEAFGIALGFVTISLLTYRLYGRHRSEHDFALVHLLKRVVDTKWQDTGLDTELMDIVTRRDRLPPLSDTGILNEMTASDLPDDTSLDDLWHRASEDLAAVLETDAAVIRRALSEREAAATTALTPFTAIPHAVLEGENRRFAIRAYRSMQGIAFSESAGKVHSVFVCVGTGDVRHTHLEALAAVARFVSVDEFDYRWIGAGDSAELTAWMKKEMAAKGG